MQFFFIDFSFEYLSILAGTLVFAVVSVKAQMKKEVNFCFINFLLFGIFNLVFVGSIV